MAVNIKNDRVEHLLDEVTTLTGESKTEAIRRALEERRDRLTRYPSPASPSDRLMRVLEREIWPSIPEGELGKPLTKTEREAILGLGPHGV